MKLRSALTLGITAMVLGGSGAPTFADDVVPANTPADNSAVNKLDRNPSEPTADQAKNTKSDIEIMRQIRKSLVNENDPKLSTYARNVKIISQNGHVTLKGTVHTEAEKILIGEKATAVAGPNVSNNIKVKGS